MGTALSLSRSWAWPCALWGICPTRWNWRSSSRDWTWTVRTTTNTTKTSCYTTVNEMSVKFFPFINRQEVGKSTYDIDFVVKVLLLVIIHINVKVKMTGVKVNKVVW